MMRKMDMSVSEILEGFEDGYFVKSELITRLIQASVYFEPKEILEQISEELAEQINEKVCKPPNTVNDVYILGGKNYSAKVSSSEIEAIEELERVVSFAGARRMYEYFNKA